MNWIEERFGRKQGLARLALSHLQDCLGGYQRFRAIEWSRVQRFVFVCQGNICRSPYAEARGAAAGMRCASFGLDAPAGDRANPAASKAARARGLDLGTHRSKPAGALSLEPGDLLIAMEPEQAERLRPLARKSGAQVTLLGLWCRPRRPHLQDPFGLSDAYFATCCSHIDRAVANLVAIQASARTPRSAPQVRPS
ncbi:MAG: hypothetical protein NVS4B10_14150 [Myxococcales bacterium]